jgi:hypothetical protein
LCDFNCCICYVQYQLVHSHVLNCDRSVGQICKHTAHSWQECCSWWTTPDWLSVARRKRLNKLRSSNLQLFSDSHDNPEKEVEVLPYLPYYSDCSSILCHT